MNKSDLVSAVSAKAGLTKAQAEGAVAAVFDSITEALKGGADVRLVPFATFEVAQRAAGTARNPKTGETIQVPAKKVVKIKAGKGLRDAVA